MVFYLICNSVLCLFPPGKWVLLGHIVEVNWKNQTSSRTFDEWTPLGAVADPWADSCFPHAKKTPPLLPLISYFHLLYHPFLHLPFPIYPWPHSIVSNPYKGLPIWLPPPLPNYYHVQKSFPSWYSLRPRQLDNSHIHDVQVYPIYHFLLPWKFRPFMDLDELGWGVLYLMFFTCVITVIFSLISPSNTAEVYVVPPYKSPDTHTPSSSQ